MADRDRTPKRSRKGTAIPAAPRSELGEELHHLMSAVTGKVLAGATDRVGGLTDKLSNLGTAAGGGSAGAGAKAVRKGSKMSEGKSAIVDRLTSGAQGIKGRAKGVVSGVSGKRLKVIDVGKTADAGVPAQATQKAAKKSAPVKKAAPRKASPRTSPRKSTGSGRPIKAAGNRARRGGGDG